MTSLLSVAVFELGRVDCVGSHVVFDLALVWVCGLVQPSKFGIQTILNTDCEQFVSIIRSVC